MLLTQEITLKPLRGTPNEVPRAELIMQGKATGTVIAGTVLEMAFRVGDRFLLLTTDDVPFEERLHLALLDHGLHLVDWATIGAAYSTGHLREVLSPRPATLQFRFLGDTLWTVTLFDKPIRQLPILSDPPGVARPLRLTRHFSVDGDPVPES